MTKPQIGEESSRYGRNTFLGCCVGLFYSGMFVFFLGGGAARHDTSHIFRFSLVSQSSSTKAFHVGSGVCAQDFALLPLTDFS